MINVTKAQLVDFIYNNFTSKGKKITKTILNAYPKERLYMMFITKHNCQDRLTDWINKPKLIKFMVDGIQDGEYYSWNCEYANEEDCKKEFEKQGIKIEKIVPKKNHHRCKYCGSIAEGNDIDRLCEDCIETFGHWFFSEL